MRAHTHNGAPMAMLRWTNKLNQKTTQKGQKKLELTCKTLFLLKMQDSRTVHEKAIRAPPRNSKHYFTEGRADKHKQT